MADLAIPDELRERLAKCSLAQHYVKTDLTRLDAAGWRDRARDTAVALELRVTDPTIGAPTPDEISVERALIRAEIWTEETHRLRSCQPPPEPYEIPVVSTHEVREVFFGDDRL